MPLERSGVSSRRFAGDSPGRYVFRMNCRIVSFMSFITTAPALEPQRPGDDVALDLRGTRVQAAADGIPQVPLHLLLGHVAVAAEDLDRVEARLHETLRDVQFRHGGFEHRRLLSILELAEPVDQRPARLEADLHVDNAVCDRLVLADGFSKLRAFPGVTDAFLDLAPHDAQAACEDRAAFPFHRALEHFDAAPFATEPLRHRDTAVLEDHF